MSLPRRLVGIADCKEIAEGTLDLFLGGSGCPGARSDELKPSVSCAIFPKIGVLRGLLQPLSQRAALIEGDFSCHIDGDLEFEAIAQLQRHSALAEEA